MHEAHLLNSSSLPRRAGGHLRANRIDSFSPVVEVEGTGDGALIVMGQYMANVVLPSPIPVSQRVWFVAIDRSHGRMGNVARLCT